MLDEWPEVRAVLRRLTLRRAANAMRVAASFHAARLTRRPFMWGWPVTLGVEPTTACNLRCPHCVSGLRAFERPTGRLDLSLYNKVIDELAPDLLYIMLYFQGEPYIHPQFLDMVRYAADKGLFVTTSTNGHFLDDESARLTVESGLGKLIVSLDGATAESYRQYRIGGDFDQVIAGVRRVVDWKRRLGRQLPLVDVQFIVFGHNENEIAAVRELGRSLGADRVRLKTAQIYDFDQAESWLPSDGKMSRYEADAQGNYRMKGAVPDHCWKLWIGAQMTWDGRLVPCCFDKNAEHELGRADRDSVRTLWMRGETYRQFRETLLGGRGRVEMCANCTEGVRVWA